MSSAELNPVTPAAAPAPLEQPKAQRLAMNNMIFESLLHIRNPQAIEQFRSQFGSLSTQMRKLQSIDQRIEAALTTPEKDALAKLREQEVRDLQSKDSLFQKVYSFSATGTALRPNFILNTVVRLLTPVTDEELTVARAAKEFNEAEVIIRDNAKFLHVSTLKGPMVQKFDRDVKIIQADREAAIQLKAQADQLEGEEKVKAEEAFKDADKKLIDDNAVMTKTFGFSLTRNYVAEALTAVFFVALTQEEVQRSAAQQQNTEAPKIEAKKDKAPKAS